MARNLSIQQSIETNGESKLEHITQQTIVSLFPQGRTATLKEYRDDLIRYCEELPYISLPGSRRERPSLSTLYVRRRVQQRSDEKPDKASIGREEAERQILSSRVPIVEAVRTHKHLVLLGEPGAGKSTWIHHTAQRVAEGRGEEVGITEPLLPLLVRLGALAEQEGDFTARLRATWQNELQLTLPPDFFETWPAAANCKGWLLACDGLDEVRDERTRLSFIRYLEGLAKKGHRVLITSRPAGYDAVAPKDEIFTTYKLEPFTSEDAEKFALRWFLPEEAQDKARGLLEMARSRRLTGLLANPLLVTVLAVVSYEQGTLATHRKELYREFIEVFSDEAKKRGMQAALAGELTDEKAGELILLTSPLLERVALAMQQERKTDEASLAEAAAPLLQEELGGGRHTARRRAEAWLQVIGRWSGVLVRRGARYEFLHQTFREYLAARALAEEHGADTEELWAVLEPHLLEDDWAEVISLTLAHLKDATQLVKRLLTVNAKDKAGQRPLFRAAAALADGAAVAEAVKRQVIDSLACLARTRDLWKWRERASADAALEALSRMGGETYAAEALLTLAQDTKMDARKRVEAAKALDRLGRAERAADILSTLARNTKLDADARIRAAWALGKLGRAEQAADILLSLAQDTEMNTDERGQAAWALSKLDRTEQALAVFLALAQDTKVQTWNRVRAAAALGKLGHADQAAAILLALAQSTKVPARVRVDAAEELGKLNHADQAAAILLALAQDTKVDTDARVNAAEALNRLGHAERAAAILLALAQNTSVDARYRVEAAKASGKLKRTEQAVVILLTLAQDTRMDAEDRVDAAQALGELGRAEQATAILLALVQNTSVGAWPRILGVMALGELGHADLLLDLAQDTGMDAGLRVQAVKALGKLGRADNLLALAQDTKVEARVREAAAEALGELDRAEQAAVILLILAQDTRVDAWLRVDAAGALGKLGHAELAAIILLVLVQNTRVNADDRVRAAKALGRLGRAAATLKVLEGLQALETDPKAPSKVREAARRALEQLRH